MGGGVTILDDAFQLVMAGLVPAIHVFLPWMLFKTWMPATQASEATPFFERLRAGMTTEGAMPGLLDARLRGHDAQTVSRTPS